MNKERIREILDSIHCSACDLYHCNHDRLVEHAFEEIMIELEESSEDDD